MSFRVLIIEDDSAILNQYAFYLAKAGYSVDTAEQGRKGLELAKTNQPDIILLDMLMPEISGIDVLKQLRQDGIQAKIVVLSNTESATVRQQAEELGVERYLLKVDLTPHQLADVIKEILS